MGPDERNAFCFFLTKWNLAPCHFDMTTKPDPASSDLVDESMTTRSSTDDIFDNDGDDADHIVIRC